MNNNRYIDISDLFLNSSIRSIFSLKGFSLKKKINRYSLAKEVGFNPSYLVNPHQVHSSNISICSKPGEILECDGVFTEKSNIVCSIQVADCLPLFFAHRSECVFGLVHAGWRGLVNNIILESGFLLRKHGFNLSEYEIVIGPSIQSCCFEVRDDIIDNFSKRYVKKTEHRKYKVDLQKFAFDKCLDIGFKSNNIIQMNECTFCNSKKYYSFRKEGEKSGRMIGLIGTK